MRDVAQDYAVRGAACAIAYERLAEGCTFPPSWEVFAYELAEAKRRAPMRTVTPEDVAHLIVGSYKPTGEYGYRRPE